MTSQIRSTSELQVLNGSEQTQLADVTTLLTRPIGELTEIELGQLLEFRRVLAERAPRLASTVQNVRRELERLDNRLEQVELGMRRGPDTEALGQFVERVATASRILDTLSELEASVLQLVLAPEGNRSRQRDRDAESTPEVEAAAALQAEEVEAGRPARNGVELFKPSAVAALEVSKPSS